MCALVTGVQTCALPIYGYAVFHADLDPEAETRLPVIGRITAGQPTLPVAQRGGAIRIFTGARLPPGLEGAGPDTVMMQEDCVPDGAPEANPDALWVVIRPGIKQGANARKAGDDVDRG